MKIFKASTAIVLSVLLSACNLADRTQNNTSDNKIVETITGQNQKYEVIAENLSNPWSIQMVDKTFYLTERNGNMIEISNGKTIRKKLKTSKPVVQTGEGGLLGFILAPNFKESQQAYAYHTYKENGEIYNRVILMKRTNSAWEEVRPIIEGIPGATFHNGGRLAIGPDQNLYITTGDASQESNAQSLKSLAGKILRLKLNGEIPKDNPFSNSPIYSYGHRNAQGLAWTKDGIMYSSEHGPSPNGGHDEINKIEPGKNYGWPVIVGDAKKPGMETPLYQTGDETWAPSGIKINDHNEILIACLKGEKLVKYSISTGKVVDVFTGVGRVRDVYIQDKNVYIITGNGNNDKLIRITI